MIIKKTFFFILAVLLPAAAVLQSYMAGNWYSILHSYSLGILFGIAAWILFLTTLLLSCRIRFIEKKIGQDTLIGMHKNTASAALIAAVLHAYFKIQFSSSITIQHLTGFSGASILIVISVFSVLIMSRYVFAGISPPEGLKNRVRVLIRYSTMKFVHNGLPLALFIILFHILIASSTAEITLRSVFILVTGVPVLLLWIFHKLVRPHWSNKGRVTAIVPHSPYLFSLDMDFKSPFDFKPGQFAFFRLEDLNISREEHPFTFAGKGKQSGISLLVKKEGKWTCALADLKPGAAVRADGPYGNFTFHDSGPMLWIAGGVGITPFLAKIRLMQDKDCVFSFPVKLIWTAAGQLEMPFAEVFEKHALKDKMFSFIPVRTREQNSRGRLSAERICGEIESLRDPLNQKPSIWFCGSFSLRETVLNGVKMAGLSGRDFHYEAFSV